MNPEVKPSVSLQQTRVIEELQNQLEELREQQRIHSIREKQKEMELTVLQAQLKRAEDEKADLRKQIEELQNLLDHALKQPKKEAQRSSNQSQFVDLT